MSGVVIMLLIFGTVLASIAVIYMFVDFICVLGVKNKKWHIKTIFKTECIRLCVGLLISSIGYILCSKKMLGEIEANIQAIVIAYIISAVPVFITRISNNYKYLHQKKEHN